MICYRRGHPDRAFEWAEHALRILEGVDAPSEKAQALNLLGVLYRVRGKLEWAADCCQRSALLYEQIGNSYKAAAAHNGLGVIAFERDDWPGADTAYCRALNLQEASEDAFGQAFTHSNLADLYWRQGRLEEALAHAQTGLQIAERIGAGYPQALACENLGAIHLRQGASGAVAREHLDTSWQLLQEHDIQDLRSEVQSLLAETYLRDKPLDEAESAAKCALDIALEQESPVDEGVARRTLAWVYAAQGDREGSIHELEASQAILEGKSQYEKARTLKELAARYAPDATRRVQAQDSLRHAIAIFRTLGAGLDLDQARALWTKLGFGDPIP
jgi:tetratricopeptide (TPR) repeat protein